MPSFRARYTFSTGYFPSRCNFTNSVSSGLSKIGMGMYFLAKTRNPPKATPAIRANPITAPARANNAPVLATGCRTAAGT